MAKYRVDTEGGSYEVETEDAAPTPAANKPALYGHPGYQSKMPSFLGRMDNAVSDSVNAMAEGAQNAFGSGKTVDERLGGVSQAARGFLNSAGLPFMLQAGVASPARVAKGVVTGLVGQKVGTETAKALGAGPGTQDFVGDATGVLTGAAGSQVPAGRTGSALYGGGKGLLYNLPFVGKTIKSGVQGAVEGWRKSAPDYVDPKVTRQAELTTQAGDRAAARVRATAEAKAKLKADAEAKVKADTDAAKVADAAKAKALAARVEATPGGPPEIPAQPPLPEVTPVPPADGRSPSGRLYGTGNRPPLTPTPPPQRTALWQGNQPQPVAPQMTPQQPATGQLPSGRIPGTGEPAGAPPEPPVRTPLWQRSAPVPNAPIEMTPQQPPTPRAPRVVREAPQPAQQVAPPAVAPQPQAPAPPAAVNGGGPSAPEGSAVIPPVAGRPNRYGDMGGKLGEQVARDAHLKDTAVAKYLNEQKVTQGQFRAADPAQKARWAREANPKYKGYTDPDRIDDLANLLQPDAPAPAAGPTLYQGKKK